MVGLSPVSAHIKSYGTKYRTLYAMSFLVLFFALFDGLLGYLVPLLITNSGISKTMMGFILGTSSMFGFVFDILLCKAIKKTSLRRLYIILFVICAVYPLILYHASTVWLYILAMGVWGLYYDLFNIGRYDFVGRNFDTSEHAHSFGILGAFSGLGYLLVPFFAGFLISKTINFIPFIWAWIFLFAVVIFFIFVLAFLKKDKKAVVEKEKKTKLKFSELFIWERIGKVIYPVLILTVLLNVINAVFWTVGPLLIASWTDLGVFSSLFLAAYLFPPLFVGWFVGIITKKFGTKKTGNVCLLIGSLALASFFLVQNHIVILVLTFISGFFISLAYPANNGTYADYIEESEVVAAEIESQADLATNLGYVIGPILAGFFADVLGNVAAFSVIGLIGVFVAILLLIITPRKITIKLKKAKQLKA